MPPNKGMELQLIAGVGRLRSAQRVAFPRRVVMQAALVRLRIDPAQAPAAAATFSTKILPRVSAAAGFVQGYWLDPVDGEGFGFVVFETAEQARDATPPHADWSTPGVTINATMQPPTAHIVLV